MLDRLILLENEKNNIIKDINKDIKGTMKKRRISFELLSNKASINISILHRVLNNKIMRVKDSIEFYNNLYQTIKEID